MSGDRRVGLEGDASVALRAALGASALCSWVMKRFAWFAVPPVAILGLASLPLACFSSDASPPAVDDASTPVPPDDSGLPTGQDATVPTIDSGSSDAGADTATTPADAADGAPAPVTVKVLLGAAPESEVLVVFQDATGAVLSSATTDATGTVSRIVAAGSQVTAALGTAQSPNLVTVEDVEPGDTLTLLDLPTTNPPNSQEDVAVTLPATTWDGETANVYVNAGACGDPVGSDVFIESSCTSQGTFPLFARATDATGEVAYTYQTGNAVAADGGPLAITVSRPWSTSTATETISASTLPTAPEDGGPSLGVSFDYTEVAGGVPLALGSVGAPAEEEGGVSSEAFVVHPGYPDYTQQDALFYLMGPNSSSPSEVFAVTRSAPPTASQTTALALGTLPGFTSASINGDDAGTPVQPVVSWTTTGSLSGANGIFTMMQWYAPAPDGGSQQISGTWTIVAPATATSVQAPSMPAEAAAFTPPATASYNPPRVVAVLAPFLAGYSAFKSQFATIPIFTPGSAWEPSIPLLPANGLTLYASVIYPNEG